MPVESITTDQIDAFVRHCQTAKGNSGATVNRKLSCLSRVLRTAHERGKLAVLPRMPRRSEGEHRVRFLSHEEEARLTIILQRLALPDVADAVLCLLYTGFRCGELWRLERRDIDLERGTLTAWKTKNHHPRTIPLVEKLRPIIARRAAACRQDTDRFFRAVATNGYAVLGPLFATSWGKTTTRNLCPTCCATHAPHGFHRPGCR